MRRGSVMVMTGAVLLAGVALLWRHHARAATREGDAQRADAWRPSSVWQASAAPDPAGLAPTPPPVPVGTPQEVPSFAPVGPAADPTGMNKPLTVIAPMTAAEREELHRTAAEKARANMPWLSDETIAKLNALADEGWDMESRLSEEVASGQISREEWQRQRMATYASIHAREDALVNAERPGGAPSTAPAPGWPAPPPGYQP